VNIRVLGKMAAKDYEVTNDLGTKLVVRTKCIICNSEMLDAIHKNGTHKEFICETCEQEVKGE